MNIHIAHAQYACYRTLYSAVIADSFVKYREKANKYKQGINVVLSRQSIENGGGVYSCNFEGNKHSLLYSLLGSPKHLKIFIAVCT